jgi:hypothetical protein
MSKAEKHINAMAFQGRDRCHLSVDGSRVGSQLWLPNAQCQPPQPVGLDCCVGFVECPSHCGIAEIGASVHCAGLQTSHRDKAGTWWADAPSLLRKMQNKII